MSTNLYYFDSNLSLQFILSNDAPGACPFEDPDHIEGLDLTNELQFTTPADNSQAQQLAQGGFIGFFDKDQDFLLFEITLIEAEDSFTNGLQRVVYCKSVFEETDKLPVIDKRPQDTTAAAALASLLEGQAKWQVGIVADLGTNSTNFYYESIKSGVIKILNTWGGELKTRVTFANNKITGFFIDILARRGADTGKRITIDKDAESIKHKVDKGNIFTAIYPRGKGQQTDTGGYTRRLTIADKVWSKAAGDPADKPAGQEWIGSEDARLTYGIPDGNGNMLHRYGFISFDDIEDLDKLINAGWDALQENIEPLVNYEAKITDLEAFGLQHEAIRLGDTNFVLDYNFVPPIQTEARIIKLKRRLNDDTQTEPTLGNFLPAFSNNLKTINDLQEKVGAAAPIWNNAAGPVTDTDIEDITPEQPANFIATGSFKKIILEWDFNPALYISSYEVYGSQVPNFTADSSNLLWRGKGSGWAHEPGVNQQWYYLLRGINTHGTAGPFTNYVTATTARIITDDMLFGSVNADIIADLAVTANELADNAASNTKVADNAITNAKIADNAVNTAEIVDLALTNAKIADNAINNAKLADLAVTATELANGAVGNNQLANNAVDNAKLADLAVTAAELADNAVTNAKVADLAISTAELADLAAATGKIADLAIATGKLAALAADATKLADNAVTNAKVADNAINTAEIVNLAVSTAKIANLAVGTAAINDLAVTTGKINNLAVTNAQIANLTVDSGQIKDLAIVNAKIGDLAVNTAELANLSVASGKIANLAVGNAAIANLAVTSGKIDNLAVGSAQIADLAVTDGKIANLAVGTAAIQDLAVTNAKINDIVGDKIQANTIAATKIALADFRNLATVNENFASTIHSAFGGVTLSGGYIKKADVTSAYMMFAAYGANMLKDGDKIYFDFKAFAAAAVTVSFTIWAYDKNMSYIGGSSTSKTGLALTTTEQRFTGEITVNAGFTGAAFYCLGLSATANADVSARQVFVYKKGGAELIIDGSVSANLMAANSITASNAAIADLAVLTAKINDLAVTTAKINNLAVGNAAIANAAVDAAKIKDLSVGTAEIADLSITNGKIANLAIDNAKIADATITSAKISSIDAAKITTGTLTAITISGVTINGSTIVSDATNAKTTISGGTVRNDSKTNSSYYTIIDKGAYNAYYGSQSQQLTGSGLSSPQGYYHEGDSSYAVNFPLADRRGAFHWAVKSLGANGSTGRWIRIAQINNTTDLGGSEYSTFQGTLYIQANYGNTANSNVGPIHFNFGVRGGTIKPVVYWGGNMTLDGGNAPRFMVMREDIGTGFADYWLWLWQPPYSDFATFIYFAPGCTTWFQVESLKGTTSWDSSWNTGDVQPVRFGRACKIDSSGGIARWQQNDSNYIAQAADGSINFYMGGTYKHVFWTDGTKTGGSIEIDGKNLGMSPIDSPQVLLETVEFNIQLDNTTGIKIYLDPQFAKAVNNKFAVFPNNGQVIEKGPDYFIIKGDGLADCRIVGERVGYEGAYWLDLDTYQTDLNEQIEGGSTVEQVPIS